MKRLNPETSIEAFKSLRSEDMRNTYESILSGLSVLKEATSEELAKFLKCKPDKIWKRMSELNVKYKLIYRPGNRRPLKSGCNGYTWKLVEGVEGDMKKITERIMPGLTVSDYSKKIIPKNQPTPLF